MIRVLLVPSKNVLEELIKGRELWDEIKSDKTVLCKICNIETEQNEITLSQNSYQIINKLMTEHVDMSNMDDTIASSDFLKNLDDMSITDIISDKTNYNVDRAVFFIGCGSVLLDCLSRLERHTCADYGISSKSMFKQDSKFKLIVPISKSNSDKMNRIARRIEYTRNGLNIDELNSEENLYNLSYKDKYLDLTPKKLIETIEYEQMLPETIAMISDIRNSKKREFRSIFESYKMLPIVTHALKNRGAFIHTKIRRDIYKNQPLHVTNQVIERDYELITVLKLLDKHRAYGDKTMREIFKSMSLSDYCDIRGTGEITSIPFYLLMRMLGVTEE